MPKTPTPAAPPTLAHLAEKEPTALHENFAAWIESETGYRPDLKTVQLAAVLRGAFQKSEANQADLAARRKAAEDRSVARAERAAAPKAEKAEKVAETPKPKPPAKKAASKAAAPAEEPTPTVARPTRRRKAAAS